MWLDQGVESCMCKYASDLQHRRRFALPNTTYQEVGPQKDLRIKKEKLPLANRTRFSAFLFLMRIVTDSPTFDWNLPQGLCQGFIDFPAFFILYNHKEIRINLCN